MSYVIKLKNATRSMVVKHIARSVSLKHVGRQGVAGPAGAAGAAGPQGDPGPDGAPGADGVVQSIVAGTNITVDDTDPANPVVASTASGGGGAVDSVNGQTGVVVLDSDDISDTGHTNKFVTAAEKTKLSNLSGTNTGDQDLSGYVPTSRTVNAKPLSSNITLNQDEVLDGTTYKQYSATEKTKLAGIAIAATANSTDAQLRDRSTHTGTQTASTISDFSSAADARITAQKGQNSGLAELDSGGKVPAAQLPSYVDDVLEVANFAALPGTGATGVIYITQDDNKTYRWTGSAYAEISASLALGETSATAYRGDRGKAAYDHSLLTSGNPHAVTKSEVGLGNADNTSDANKPVSTAQATADALVASNAASALASHEADTTSVHGIANTASLETTSGAQAKADAKVTQNITNGVTTTAPSEDAVFDALALKAPLASPTFTGTFTLPTGLTGVVRADAGVVSTDSDVTDIVAAASTSAAGKVELATTAETDTGTDTVRAVTPDGLSGSIYGTKPVSIQVIDGATSLTTGDGKAYFRIPTALNGMDLISVAASVIAKSTSGTPTVQLARGRQANATSAHSFTDMLTTKVTIDANEFDSKDAAAAVAIDTANDDVLTGDLIRIDVDVAGTGTTGLFVTCAFRTP